MTNPGISLWRRGNGCRGWRECCLCGFAHIVSIIARSDRVGAFLYAGKIPSSIRKNGNIHGFCAISKDAVSP